MERKITRKQEYLYYLAYTASLIWMIYAYFIDPDPRLFGGGEIWRDINAVFDGMGWFLCVFAVDMIFEGPIWKELLKERTEKLEKMED